MTDDAEVQRPIEHSNANIKLCDVCEKQIPAHHHSEVYCSDRCKRRAKRLRQSGKREPRGPGFTCPSCNNTVTIPVSTPVGSVCADCAPFRSCDKLAYSTQEAAQWAATGFRVRSISEPRFKDQRAYLCRLTEDRHWHLTTKVLKK